MKIFNSIRWRLQIWYGLILVTVLAGFGFTAYQLERARQFRRIDDELQRRVGALASALRQLSRDRGPGPGGPERRPFDRPPLDGEGRPERPRPERPFNDGPPERFAGPRDFQLPPQYATLFDPADSNGFYFVIWRRNQEELARSANTPAGVSLPVSRTPVRNGGNVPDGPPELRPAEPQPPQTRGNVRETTLITPPGEIILVGRSIERERNELRRTAWRLSGAGGIILLVGFAGGWWMVSRAIRPIETISATAAKISAGDLAQRINVAETESELGRLASVLNSTFARLDAAFRQQQQFTSDAAHELRTPVSVMLTQTQTALNRERSAGQYRETLESCQRAAQRMRRLIESLLELARLDAGQQQMKRMPFDLSQTARDCVELLQPLAAEQSIKLICELPTLNCVGDAQRLGQVVTNLLTNAIHYNKEGGEVRLSGEARNDSVILRVRDTGEGIAPDDLPRVFDRFFRADQSRSSGNAGLGLAISKAIVEAHGGTIEVASKLEEGTTFTIHLPNASA